MSFKDQMQLAIDRAMFSARSEIEQRLQGFTSAVIDDTPVLSGALKGGWKTAFSAGQIQDTGTVDPTGTTVKALAIVAIRSIPSKKDWELFFGNKRPYIHAIEFEGYSRKAPDGMLRKNIVKGGPSLQGFSKGKR